ncbi:hypothetical protein F2Q69_00022708 [Brassica cretica]|uniref:Uncharacterized protein n=1 Tax=Brassica cretica TaxID=69181 RepID=A0A8S9Q7E5_BRACR|nr:hypothetical protein F2Q69_00022708 [Brassica cretica]
MPPIKHGTTKFPGSLFVSSVILYLIFSLIWWNILLMSSSVSLISLKNIYNMWLLSSDDLEPFISLPQGYSHSSLINLHRLGCIFRLLTDIQRGAHRSKTEDDCRSPVGSLSRSVSGSLCRSMLKRKGLGGRGCLAVNSSWVMILTVSNDATDFVDRC